MNQTSILYPACAMFAMTFCLIAFMGISRFIAVRRRETPGRFYITYDEGEEIPRLRRLTRHVHNHFEVPPLFYIGVILTYVTGSISTTAIAFAWGFVAARLVHAAVHLGYNNVLHRFLVFGVSIVCLGGLWISLLLSLVRQ